MLLKKREPKNAHENDWWGYLHTNGTIQVKGYYSIEQIHDAQSSPFVLMIVNPFKAPNREEAVLIITKKLEDARKRKEEFTGIVGGSSTNSTGYRRKSAYGLEA